MARIIVTAKPYAGKAPRTKVTAAKATGNNLSTNNGGYFTDGTTTGDDLTTAATGLETALDNYDAGPTELNRELAIDAETACDLKMDDAVGYTQKKVNAESDLEICRAIAVAAALGVRKAYARQPKPETVTEAGAEFSGIPQTILLKIKKKSKFAKYFECYVSLTPEDESSWVLKDTCSAKKLLVKGLTTGQKYFLRIIACNDVGKSDPSEIYSQIAA